MKRLPSIVFLAFVCASSLAQAPVARLRDTLRESAHSPASLSPPPDAALCAAPLPSNLHLASVSAPLVSAPFPGIRESSAKPRMLRGATMPPLVSKDGRIASLSAPLHAPAPPAIAPGTARHAAAALAYDLLQEGRGDPRSAEWRPYLAELVARPLREVDALAMYRLFLASFDGIDSRARMALAESWANRHEEGRYAGAIALASLRSLFQSGEYGEVESRAERVAADHPDQAAQALSLRVLCQVYRNDLAAADESVAALLRDFKGTSDEPEILYLAAWLRIEQGRVDEARMLLESLLSRFPNTPAAKKARSALEELTP